MKLILKKLIIFLKKKSYRSLIEKISPLLGVKDLKTMLICFLIASIFWVMNSLNKEQTISMNYPIEVVANEKKFILLTPISKNIVANVTGTGWKLLRTRINSYTKPVKIPIKEPMHKNHISSIDVRDILIQESKNLEINYVVEDSFFFQFDTLMYKNLICYLDASTIDLKDQYRITFPIRISPSYLILRAPSSFFNDYDDSVQLRINKTKIDRDFNEPIFVTNIDNDLVDFVTDNVKVSFDVVYYTKKIVPLDIKKVNFPSKDVIIYPDYGFIEFYVNSEELLDVLNPIETIINFQDIDYKDSTIVPVLSAVPGIEDICIMPDRFKVIAW